MMLVTTEVAIVNNALTFQNEWLVSSRLLEQLSSSGQQHLLRFWGELSDGSRRELVQQLSSVDWDQFGKLIQSKSQAGRAVTRPVPPKRVVRTVRTPQERNQRDIAEALGAEVLSAGRVAVILVAGGQGTRLGFPQPKGMFPIGPVTGKSLFQVLAEKVVATCRRYQTTIPYLVMTSDSTHEATVKWFADNGYFGLDPVDVYFFQQGCLPVLDSQTGKILLADKGRICMSADGHGGVLAAIKRAGLFEELHSRGVDYLFYHQVDNPLVRVCDPAFLGYHVLHESEASTKVVAKRAASEKVGVLVEVDGRTEIIEYSDLPADLSSACNADGSLQLWAGNTAIHIFNRSFLEFVAAEGGELPWHAAKKKTPFVDERGQLVQPSYENGLKFERFIFDALPLADHALIVETERAEEFAPLKSQEGESSPASVTRCMVEDAIAWLKAAGLQVPSDVPIEISPLAALGPEDLIGLPADELRSGLPVYIAAKTDVGHFEVPPSAEHASPRIVPR
jgi:UDP-N-acetylglucosamine/UDP-N-acetylgalactosamine diphosphorylase